MEAAALPGEAGPEFVQSESFHTLSYFSGLKAPIFLIHDGGGTTFTYHLLQAQGRFVYAISNPHFYTTEPFEGGLPEMGRIYADYIRTTVKKREFPTKRSRDGRSEILLGGWSLGGLLSLEVARQLAPDWRIKVVGIVMIDSVYYPGPKTQRELSSVGFQIDETGKTKNQILAQRSMTEARRMVASWEVPVWDGRFAEERPRTILLRATERLETKEDEGPSSLDRLRDDSQLGWGHHQEDFLEDVVDIPGNHFTLAEMPYIDKTSEALKMVCDRLDQPRR